MKTPKIILFISCFLISIFSTFGQSEATKKVAILETIDKEGKVSYGVKLMVRSNLAYAITNTPGYEGYDRVDIASIMSEQEFQRTGMVNDAQIKKLGEMVGADYILVAEVAYLNSSNIFITAQILNVESAKLERTANVQAESTTTGLGNGCRILAEKLLSININTGASKGSLKLKEGDYNGEYKNGKPHGYGTIYFSSNDEYQRKSYEGNWVNGIRQGKGTMVWTDGEKYIGEWHNGSRNGQGIEYYSNGNRYEGNWVNSKKNGYGTFFFTDGDKYVGNFKDGNFHGQGTYYYNDGDKYVGNWVNDKINGYGTMYYSNGARYEGNWENGRKNGQGTYYYTNGNKYVGEWKDGKKNGWGTWYWRKGGKEKDFYVNGKEII